jgi:peptide chain release factor 1
MSDIRLRQSLDDALRRLKTVDEELSDPAVLQDRDRLRELSQERAELAPIAQLSDELSEAEVQLEDALSLSGESDDVELAEMAEEEAKLVRARIGKMEKRVRRLLVPEDPLEGRAAVVEIRAGTGGDEAGLFASDLVRMYRRYAERAGWTVDVLDLSEGIPGAIKEAILDVRGRGVYGRLRFESGVHRVQRVPETESQGRVHTSAATVAVLPEAEEVDVRIEPTDLRIDVFRSSGPGGQSVNTTDSAVRITHLPTDLVVTCQDEKSQHKNKAKAMKVLRSRLLDRAVAAHEAERSAERRTQVGTGDRSAKIRTYNFPQGRVTDHRIGLTLHRLPDVLGGDLDELIDALALAHREERMGSDEA